MANFKFNPNPRLIIIQPINGHDIYYYAVAMDFPNEMGDGYPYLPGIVPVQQGDTMNIQLQDGFVFPNPYPDDPNYADFTTQLAPLYTNYVKSENGPQITKVNVIDAAGVARGGALAQSKPVIKFEKDPLLTDADVDQAQPLNVFRPFVIKNSSNATNAYFAGGMMRIANDGQYYFGLQCTSDPNTFGNNLLVIPNGTGVPSGVNYYNMIGLFPSYYKQYETITCEQFSSDPKSTGYFTQGDSSLYDIPDGEI